MRIIVTKGRQTDLVKDYKFPRVHCNCAVKCSVLSEGIIKCCKDCVKYGSLCHSSCEKIAETPEGKMGSIL